jgi:hypothetical protein
LSSGSEVKVRVAWCLRDDFVRLTLRHEDMPRDRGSLCWVRLSLFGGIGQFNDDPMGFIDAVVKRLYGGHYSVVKIRRSALKDNVE